MTKHASNSLSRLSRTSALMSSSFGRPVALTHCGDFKIQRRGRQRERQKTERFNERNNNFSRASRFFVHFFAVFARLRRQNA